MYGKHFDVYFCYRSSEVAVKHKIFTLTLLYRFFHVKHHSPTKVKDSPRFDRGIARRKSGGLNGDDAGGLIRDNLR